MKQLKPWLWLAGAAVVLAACGGGGGGDAAPAPANPLDTVPGEATQSSSGWIDYLTRLTQASDAESREGVAVSEAGIASAPADEAGEPVTLSP